MSVKKTILLCAAPVLVFAVFEPATQATPARIDDAIAAYRQSHVSEAKTNFAAVASDDHASTKDRATARRELARIAWLIDADFAGAVAQLNSADAWKDEPCETAAMLVRVLRESGRAREAVHTARAHAAQCTDHRDGVLIQEARALADLAMKADTSSRAEALNQMKTSLSRLSDEGSHSLDGARLSLELGLLSATADRGIEGWKTFFWLTQDDAPPALLAEFPHAGDLFRRALTHQPKLQDEVALLRLLVRAGFYEQAKQFEALRVIGPRAQRARSSEWPLIKAHFEFHETLDRITLAHYRRIAHGKGDASGYQSEITKAIEATATKLRSRLGDPNASTKSILLHQWGVHFTIGPTGGFMSLHLGHVIEDARESIAQHGRTAEVERIVLENMLSNAYEGWLWDGWAQAGGWAEAGARIIQVRTSYVKSVLKAFGLRPGTPARARADAELVELRKGDDEVLQAGRLADLRGMSDRLRLQSTDQICAAMKDAGESADNAKAFQARYWRALVGATITIHEGRHALDQKQYPGAQALSSEELEYRAKLSELEFGEYPRMSLASIVTGQIGGESSHGKANTRLLRDLRQWIETHSSEVSGFDSHRLPLAQIDKLTDHQLRAFATSREDDEK